MPTYTYECKSCESNQTELHGIMKTPRVKCNDCGASCRKLFGQGGHINFVGPGFYANDHKHDNERVTIRDKKAGTTRRVK